MIKGSHGSGLVCVLEMSFTPSLSRESFNKKRYILSWNAKLFFVADCCRWLVSDLIHLHLTGFCEFKKLSMIYIIFSIGKCLFLFSEWLKYKLKVIVQQWFQPWLKVIIPWRALKKYLYAQSMLVLDQHWHVGISIFKNLPAGPNVQPQWRNHRSVIWDLYLTSWCYFLINWISALSHCQ